MNNISDNYIFVRLSFRFTAEPSIYYFEINNSKNSFIQQIVTSWKQQKSVEKYMWDSLTRCLGRVAWNGQFVENVMM